VNASGWFFCQEKGESRYEETIPDRPATGRAAVPPARHRTQPQYPDDSADGRHRRLVAGGCGQLAAARGTGTDAAGDGRRSEVAGGRAPPATRTTPRASLGQGRWLLRGGWPKGADQADAIAQRRPSRTTLGELRTVSARRAFAARRLGQDDAGTFDAQLRRGGEGLSIRLWNREVGGERELHRGQSREGEAVDGASAGRLAVVRRADRRHAIQRPTDDCSPWDWLRWTQNRTGHPRRCDGKHRRGEQPIE